jgi:ABC-type nitrate/sulfonate/bicarbonate transport system permease component
MTIALGLWEIAILIWKFPAFILPGPGLVAIRFLRAVSDGSLIRHLLITLFEVVMGLVIGAGFATILKDSFPHILWPARLFRWLQLRHY